MPNALSQAMAQMVKNLPAMQETQIQSLGQEDPLEKGMATLSSILAWRIPRTEEPGTLQSKRSQRVGHDWATNTLTFTFHTHTHTYTIQFSSVQSLSRVWLYSAIKKKKNEIMSSAATWADLDVITLSEGSQTEKDKYHISLTCGI